MKTKPTSNIGSKSNKANRDALRLRKKSQRKERDEAVEWGNYQDRLDQVSKGIFIPDDSMEYRVESDGKKTD